MKWRWINLSFLKKLIPNFLKKKSIESSKSEVEDSDSKVEPSKTEAESSDSKVESSKLKNRQKDGLPDWLREMLEEEEEENPERWVDESDYLIMSLGASMLFLGLLLLIDNFTIPDPLFLGVAIFSIYFLVVTSMRKNNRFKLYAVAFTFPFTLNLSMFIVRNDFDISKINNSLSLAAIGFSLFYLPRQKIRDRSQLERNKLKTKIIRDDHAFIKKQDEIIKLLENTIENLDNSLTEMQQMLLEKNREFDVLDIAPIDDEVEKKEDRMGD